MRLSVKASISLTDGQGAYARRLVEEGSYSSVSAVLQRGLELLRLEHERNEAELAALRGLLGERRVGAFVSLEEGSERTARMIAAKREARGL